MAPLQISSALLPKSGMVLPASIMVLREEISLPASSMMRQNAYKVEEAVKKRKRRGELERGTNTITIAAYEDQSHITELDSPNRT